VKQIRNARAESKKAGFLIFVVAILLVDFIAGFVYGFIGEHGKRTETIRDPATNVTATESDPKDVSKDPGTGVIIVHEQGDPERTANDDDKAGAGQDDPDSFESIVEQLLAAANALDDVGEPPDDPGENTPPESVTNADPDPEKDPGPTVVDDDPEDDLYTFNVPNGKPLSAEIKRGDEYLQKAKQLLAKWNKTRAKRDMTQAKAALYKAKDCYGNAKRSSDNKQYIEQQLKLTNQLLYLTIKSSQF
jgi:hypothetical protein